MKVLAKPMSSPGRAEKYPPPLMRFLRSNVGSRSRGRSRSSPMFVHPKKTAAIETQEPTSPKVTCMGQVRVRRSKQHGKRTGAPKTKQRCKWVKKAFFCRHFDGKIKPKSLKPVWPKWVTFCRMIFRSKNKIREESTKRESKFGSKSEDFVQEEAEEEEEEAKVFASSSSTPPRNALLLTRCRSAPYRSSSLASRFWGSPLATEETEQKEASTTTTTTGPQNRGNENPASGKESVCRDSDQESKMDAETGERLELFKEFDAPINKIRERFMKSEEVITEEMVTVRPLILTRCKSEPARTGARLDPDMIFLNKRRLGFSGN